MALLLVCSKIYSMIKCLRTKRMQTKDAGRYDVCLSSEGIFAKQGFEITNPGLTGVVAIAEIYIFIERSLTLSAPQAILRFLQTMRIQARQLVTSCLI